MSRISIDKLIEKLDSVSRTSLESAAAIAARSSNVTVDIAHWLAALLENKEVTELLERCRVSVESARRELAAALDDLPRGEGGSLTLSPNLILWAREAFTLANLQHGRSRISPGDLFAALLDEPTLRAILRGAAPSLRSLSSEALEAELSQAREEGDGPSALPSPVVGAGKSGDDFLALYTQDLTAAARAGQIDPVIGRERELRQVVDVLMRRRQNNPILVGEAGVGKTAIAEALALEIVAGALPERLADVRLLSLDLGLLQAGAGIKGEFERRLRGVIDAVKASAEPIILFIDEAHMLMGAGAQPGQGDAANLLKPALARGELRTLAATTFSEYKRYIEKDAALTRRFQAVKVDEPDEARAVAMLRGIADRFEDHHGVVIRHSALAAAVSLSARYIPDRQLPDKAISLVDTAAASVALSRHGLPDPIRAAQAEKERLDAEHRWLSREPASIEASERLAAILARQGELEETIAEIDRRYEAQRQLADDADRLEALLAQPEQNTAGPRLDGHRPSDALMNGDADAASHGEQDRGALQAALADAERRLKEEAGSDPLVPRVVDGDTVAAVVARWTGIPVGKLLVDEIATVRSLDERLKERIIGQNDALERIAASMRSARAGLSDPRRPPAVFLLVGLSGTGKTETALALADLLYGGPQHMTTINMSEFKEEHKVSMLLGSPPGYVGYGEGGVLTEAVRRRPYGVLLLDEIDKAHPGVQDIFFQVFDKGMLRDGEGRDVDFKHTTILMTANSGAELLAQLAEDPDTMPSGDALETLITEELKKHFKPAFLGRTTILPYRPLDQAALSKIVALQLDRIRERVDGRYGAELVLSDAARDRLVSAARASEMGARVIEAMIGRDLLPRISSLFLQSMLEGRRVRRVTVGYEENSGFGVEATYAEPEEEFVGSKDEPTDRVMTDAALGGPDAAKRRQASAP
ncbi:type VI secretion system ATPase TssH [Consotaella aegiceratis]|uniref:type VI secretion system ATPase TssH n=1 Tax=Consotaella aegiceratis TaxID=3097961 RepID=UPI002F3EDAE0